ncbi:MAG: ATP-binding protein [bacterium]
MRRLRVRIIVYVGIALMLGLGFYCIAGLRIHTSQLLEERVRIIAAASGIIEQNIENSMMRNHKEDLQFIVENMGTARGIEEIKIFDENGKIVLASDPAMIGETANVDGSPFPKGRLPREKEAVYYDRLRVFRTEDGYRAIGMTTVIENEKRCRQCHDKKRRTLGTLDMAFNTLEIDAKTIENRNRAIIFGIVTFILVSAVISLFVKYSVYPEIRKITEGTEKIHSGDYGYSVPVHSDDEIGWLARSFNRMSMRLKRQREEQSEKWKLEMEEKVRNATDELEKTNRELTKVIHDLKKLDAMKSDVAMVIYHDLRSPLAAIQSCLNVVLEGIVGEVNPRQKDMLRRADEDIDKLLTFITDLLDLSQIEMRSVVRNLQPLQLSDVLIRTVGTFAARAEQKGLTLNLNVPSELPVIFADKAHMEQAFRNIVGNAVKYTSEGTVSVAAQEDGGFVKTTVADTGIGISEEDLPKIFDIFYRAPNAKAVEKVGTGLGMSIAKRIIEDHWGTIAVESVQGRGTTFTVKLPKAKQVQPQRGVQ